MTTLDRRMVPRKDCMLPLRFRIRNNGSDERLERADAYPHGSAETSKRNGMFEGVALNLSEQGIYFKSREKLDIGQPLEVYFTLPAELTGRKKEDVRCNARVVRIDARPDQNGLMRVGAAVERFETIAPQRKWVD